MSPIHAQQTHVLAALSATSANGLVNIALGLIGAFLIVILAARGAAAFADERHGKMITLIAAAIPVFFFCYFPSETTDIIKSLGTTLFGG